jgi:hypothetical protein
MWLNTFQVRTHVEVLWAVSRHSLHTVIADGWLSDILHRQSHAAHIDIAMAGETRYAGWRGFYQTARGWRPVGTHWCVYSGSPCCPA